MEQENNNIKIEKLKPLICGKCKGTRISKYNKKIICDDCSTVFENGKESRKTKERQSKGQDPRYFTGDYLE